MLLRVNRTRGGKAETFEPKIVRPTDYLDSGDVLSISTVMDGFYVTYGHSSPPMVTPPYRGGGA
jgi:hypothetical protein